MNEERYIGFGGTVLVMAAIGAVMVVAAVLVAQRPKGDLLDCSKSSLVERGDFYLCEQTNELKKIRELLEKMPP